MKKIAILGVTGYIGKSLLDEFLKEHENYRLFLFYRSKSKVKDTLNKTKDLNNISFHLFDEFNSFDYDVVINSTGISDPNILKKNVSSIFKVTEQMDNMVINYLEKRPKTHYVNLSSGAVYGDNFNKPINEKTRTILNINNLKVSEYYSIAKINAEAKHRSMSKLNIVDLRVFAFFSRFVDTKVGFLMSEIVDCIKNKKIFQTNSTNIVRDYISSSDLFSLIKLIIEKGKINDSFDVYSLKPVSKLEILKFLEKKYAFKYKVNESLSKESKIISKNIYYSRNHKAKELGYKPTQSSLACIENEIGYLLKKK